jgi:hypothetical protein
MKLVNHNKDNFYYDDSSCVMNGTIELNKVELEKVREYLGLRQKVAEMECDTYTRDNLPIAIESYDRWNGKSLLSLGVEGTKAIVKLFDLPNYKRQNYGIVLVN